MRTTWAIDDDVLAAARHLAHRERRSLGEVISALARARRIRMQRLLGHGQATDSCLLALALALGGQLATSDRRLVLDAVLGGAAGLRLV